MKSKGVLPTSTSRKIPAAVPFDSDSDPDTDGEFRPPTASPRWTDFPWVGGLRSDELHDGFEGEVGDVLESLGIKVLGPVVGRVDRHGGAAE